MCEALCPDLIRGEEKPRFDVLIGVEYAGFRDTTVSFELVNRHINNFDSIQQTWSSPALNGGIFDAPGQSS